MSNFSSGTFIAARPSLHTAMVLFDYACRLGLDELKIIPPHKLHATIAHTKRNLSTSYLPELNTHVPFTVSRLRYIGNALAYMIDCRWLRQKNKQASINGARTSFPSYLPHISICYDPPAGIDIFRPPAIAAPLWFSSEYIQPLEG